MYEVFFYNKYGKIVLYGYVRYRTIVFFFKCEKGEQYYCTRLYGTVRTIVRRSLFMHILSDNNSGRTNIQEVRKSPTYVRTVRKARGKTFFVLILRTLSLESALPSLPVANSGRL